MSKIFSFYNLSNRQQSMIDFIDITILLLTKNELPVLLCENISHHTPKKTAMHTNPSLNGDMFLLEKIHRWLVRLIPTHPQVIDKSILQTLDKFFCFTIICKDYATDVYIPDEHNILFIDLAIIKTNEKINDYIFKIKRKFKTIYGVIFFNYKHKNIECMRILDNFNHAYGTAIKKIVIDVSDFDASEAYNQFIIRKFINVFFMNSGAI